MTPHRRSIVVLAPTMLLAGALAVGGCAQPAGPGGTATQPAGGATPSAALPTSATNPTAPPEPPASEPTAVALEYRVTYDWGIPSDRVTIPHTVQVPIAPAPEPPLPYLVAIYVGDHPEASPQYQRISFYFRGAFPECNLQYVPSVSAEGSGEPIPLQGNAFLRVGFVNAQAHDNAGESTMTVMPQDPIGFQNLKSYGSAGDFEGHVTYGLGIQVAPNSDQVLEIRAGELKKPDGVGGTYYVVHFDVQNG
jgi:hypothetical protein